MNMDMERWMETGPYGSVAFKFGAWFSVLGVCVVILSFFLLTVNPVHLGIGFLTLMGAILFLLMILVYDAYWFWQNTKNTVFRMIKAKWNILSQTITEALEQYSIPYRQVNVNILHILLSNIHEIIYIGEDKSRILILGHPNLAWSIVFIETIKSTEGLNNEKVQRLIDTSLQKHEIQ